MKLRKQTAKELEFRISFMCTKSCPLSPKLSRRSAESRHQSSESTLGCQNHSREPPGTPGPLQPPSPPSPFYSYVKTLFLSPPPLASPRAGPPGVGGLFLLPASLASPHAGPPEVGGFIPQVDLGDKYITFDSPQASHTASRVTQNECWKASESSKSPPWGLPRRHGEHFAGIT